MQDLDHSAARSPPGEPAPFQAVNSLFQKVLKRFQKTEGVHWGGSIEIEALEVSLEIFEPGAA